MDQIDPALGLELERSRTLPPPRRSLCIGIPAHDEAATIEAAVVSAWKAIDALALPGEVVVAASGCRDDTAQRARRWGATVIEAPLGKGAAIGALIGYCRADVLCLVDADIEYFGTEPLAAAVARPVLDGTADAALANMHWRSVYPQMWLYGFFAPLAAHLYPEALATLGPTPWTGQRAAVRDLWPQDGLPTGFSVEMAINLAWLRAHGRVVTVPIDDWINPQRPKPELMREELELILDAAHADRRLRGERDAYRAWFTRAQATMARYVPSLDDPASFERLLVAEARTAPLPG